MIALAGGRNALSSNLQSSLGALADQPCLKFGHRGHLGEQEATHGSWGDVGQIAEDQIDAAADQLAEKVDILVSLSSFAKTSVAPMALACERAAASFGRAVRLPLSTSMYSATSFHLPPSR